MAPELSIRLAAKNVPDRTSQRVNLGKSRTGGKAVKPILKADSATQCTTMIGAQQFSKETISHASFAESAAVN
jgi:hypothetical protein